MTALLLTHEHSDHIKGGEGLLKNHPDLLVYATFDTGEGCRDRGKWSPTVQIIEAQHPFLVDGVEITAFRTSHDASESVGYRFEIPGFVFGIATDLGGFTAEVVDMLKDCRVLVVEANYDDELLRWSPYPAFLKKRIAGSGGHLSNDPCAQLLKKVAGPQLKQVILCHVSEKNNNPKRAIAADRHEPGPVFRFRPKLHPATRPRQGLLPF